MFADVLGWYRRLVIRLVGSCSQPRAFGRQGLLDQLLGSCSCISCITVGIKSLPALKVRRCRSCVADTFVAISRENKILC